VRQPLIRKLEHFTRLSAEDKATLDRISAQRVRRFGPREDIILEGEKPHFINLLNEGWACRYKILDDGRRQIIAFFLPGDLCDLNVFILKAMDHSIGAITPVVLSEIDRPAFDEMMLQHPRITQALWWESLVAAAIQREWTINLGQRDAIERTAHLLCEIFIRMQIAGLTDGYSCEFPLTQNDLGDTLGISTVHVNRTLQELRSADLITLKGKVLTIPKLAALETVAMFNRNYLHLDREGRHLDANES
jgi:CRP-like cAMP-binding protein